MMSHKNNERKARTLTLRLSDEDAEQLYIKAGMSGIRVTELLEHFIQDLAYSINSNGSDERDLANQWFDRCMFRDYGCGFVQFALESGNGKWAADLWQSLLEARTRLNKGISDFCDQEEMDAVRDDAAFWQEELQEYYQEYVEHGQAGGEGMEAEMQKLSKWYQELDTFIERGSL